MVILVVVIKQSRVFCYIASVIGHLSSEIGAIVTNYNCHHHCGGVHL
jgi:hypothetical protein